MCRAILRCAKIEDAGDVCRVHHASIKNLAKEHYDHDQLSAWKDTTRQLFERLITLNKSFLVATIADRVVGFGALKGREVWLLYVSPDVAGKGIGTLILKGLEDLLRKNGVFKTQFKVSTNALPFYLKNSYEKRQDSTISLKGATLDAVVVYKKL